MNNIYVIINLDKSGNNKYLSPWRVNGNGKFLWDYKINAYLFTDNIIDDDIRDFLKNTNFLFKQVDIKEFKNNPYYKEV